MTEYWTGWIEKSLLFKALALHYNTICKCDEIVIIDACPRNATTNIRVSG